MKRKAGIILRAVGDQHLLVTANGDVPGVRGLVILNHTAAFLWERLDDNRSVDFLSLAVAEQFSVGVAQARVDVSAFLSEMAGMGLIEE